MPVRLHHAVIDAHDLPALTRFCGHGGRAGIVTRPRHVVVNEMLIRPTEQQR